MSPAWGLMQVALLWGSNTILTVLMCMKRSNLAFAIMFISLEHSKQLSKDDFLPISSKSLLAVRHYLLARCGGKDRCT